MEDVQVKYDATVRTSKDNVIQFLYGEDGLDATFIENMSMELLKLSDSAMEKKYRFFNPNLADDLKKQHLKDYLNPETLEVIGEDLSKTSDALKEEFE
jgi:DNA-directed RNA polymerase II subunit RPB1